jgi:hypothetical protein
MRVAVRPGAQDGDANSVQGEYAAQPERQTDDCVLGDAVEAGARRVGQEGMQAADSLRISAA